MVVVVVEEEGGGGKEDSAVGRFGNGGGEGDGFGGHGLRGFWLVCLWWVGECVWREDVVFVLVCAFF